MPRLMSVTLTEQAVRDRQKTVTRRLGWRQAQPGDRLTLCRKVMGRRKRDGTLEPLVRLAEVEIVNTRREPLNHINVVDVIREGRADLIVKSGAEAPDEFVAWFCEHMDCQPDTEVTRIEWRYLDAVQEDA